MKTVVGLFNDKSLAERTAQVLRNAGLGEGKIVGDGEIAETEMMGNLTRCGVPVLIATRYVEGLRHGGVLEAVRVPDTEVDRTVDLMRSVGKEARTGVGAEQGEDIAIVEELVILQRGPLEGKIAEVVEKIDLRSRAGEPTETIEGKEGSKSEFEEFSGEYRTHFDSTYPQSGKKFDEYEPAYRFGHEMKKDQRYHGKGWADVEPTAQKEWEAKRPGTFENFKAAIRHAWERMKNL